MSLFREVRIGGKRDGLLAASNYLQKCRPKEIHAFGRDAEFTKRLILEEPVVDPEVDILILVDRDSDLKTLLGTPRTCEQLLYEIGVHLTNLDPIFEEIRNKDLPTAGKILNQYAIKLKQASKSRPKDLREYLELAKLKKPLDFYVNELHRIKTAEISEDLETAICQQAPVEEVLRRLILENCYNDFFKREIVQTYGFKYLLVMKEMEEAGLFQKRKTMGVADIVKPFIGKGKIMVYLVGGLTFDELHVLKEIGVDRVEGTSMITSREFIQSFISPF